MSGTLKFKFVSSSSRGLLGLCLLLCISTASLADLTLEQVSGKAAPPLGAYFLSSEQKRYLVSYPDQKIRVEEISAEGKATVILSAEPPAAELEPILPVDAATLPKLGGAAIRQQRLVCCLTRESALVFIDLKTAKFSSRQSLPDFTAPRAAAYDPQGKLWMFSGNSLTEIAFTSDGHFNPVHHEGDFDSPEHLAIAADGKLYVCEHGAKPGLVLLDAQRKRLKRVEFPKARSVVALEMQGKSVNLWLDNGDRFHEEGL